MSRPAPLSADERRALLELILVRGAESIERESHVCGATLGNVMLGRPVSTHVGFAIRALVGRGLT